MDRDGNKDKGAFKTMEDGYVYFNQNLKALPEIRGGPEVRKKNKLVEILDFEPSMTLSSNPGMDMGPVTKLIGLPATNNTDPQLAHLSLPDLVRLRLEKRSHPEYNSFQEFFSIRSSCHLVEEINGDFYCDCFFGIKGHLCKHTLALTYDRNKEFPVDPRLNAVKFQKRTAGRPKSRGLALTRDPPLPLQGGDAEALPGRGRGRGQPGGGRGRQQPGGGELHGGGGLPGGGQLAEGGHLAGGGGEAEALPGPGRGRGQPGGGELHGGGGLPGGGQLAERGHLAGGGGLPRGQARGARVRGGQPRTIRTRGGQARGAEMRGGHAGGSRARGDIVGEALVASNVWSSWQNVVGEVELQDVGQVSQDEEEEEQDQGVSSQEDGEEETNLDEEPEEIFWEL